jgi:beta-galactosidase
MKIININIFVFIFFVINNSFIHCQNSSRIIEKFNNNWHFFLGDDSSAYKIKFDDRKWRVLNLPHDWSIEGEFNFDNPSTPEGGSLPTGVGWYRKSFKIHESLKNKIFYIDFDGIYQNSEVWINEHYLGKRPNGYVSFRYNLTPYLNFGKTPNIIAVRVDNSLQPNSRWYSGSGIYRNVWLVTVNAVHVDHWGVFITTPEISNDKAKINIKLKINNKSQKSQKAIIITSIYNQKGKKIVENKISTIIDDHENNIIQNIIVNNPELWSVESPFLYKAKIELYCNNKLTDIYEIPFGIRYFSFDNEKGFFLNGKQLKILGVCMHHDLGALGSAINMRAIERQLELLKSMGCNAIRTSHNPPAPEFLDLCDKMGFIVMDEAFDMWKKKKTKNDYHLFWDKWHKTDLEDMVLRDRNHPSVFIWSIGNEIREQFDSTGIMISRELVNIIHSLDPTRPVTSALTENEPEKNYIYQSKALDILGFNYKQNDYYDLPIRFKGEKFIASETTSAFQTRGCYIMPSDSIRRWRQKKNEIPEGANPDFTASSYDNTCATWGSTHEETWKIVKKLDFISGLFIWTGFDYIGEPTPYPFPARSSYFGIFDLAGFPKDIYYMYKSEWTKDTVLHIFPHWNWSEGQIIDIWAYYNYADEVELFINNKSLGIRKKENDDLHVLWRVKFEAGELKAVARKNGYVITEKKIFTAGKPYKIKLIPDKTIINANGSDLSFITVNITDTDGNLVPYAENLINFEVKGAGFIAGVDNGFQASLESFKANYRKAFRGKCLLIIQSNGKKGNIYIKASATDLIPYNIILKAK